jgi:DnaJ-class molecular chaperone
LKLGEKMINNLSFIQLLVTDNEPSIKECKSCDGSGMERCERCKGSGLIECPTCDGDGEVSCEWCDDYDMEECEECNGSETMNCNSCAGSGEVYCPSCGGAEETVCETCGGEGEITSEDEVSYEIYFIATWNKQIQDLCELRAETLEPVMSLTQFTRLNDDYLELIRWNGSSELNLDKDQMYCIDYSNEPEMYLQKNMLIRPRNRYIRDLDYLK